MAKVTMPQLGESVAEGTIGKWLKKPGDAVAKYEPLLEVITDKVNAEVPSPYEGILREILVEEGATVPNNAEIAVIETADEGATSPTAAGPTPAAQPSTTSPTPTAAPTTPVAPMATEKQAAASEPDGGISVEPRREATSGPAGSDERRPSEMPDRAAAAATAAPPTATAPVATAQPTSAGGSVVGGTSTAGEIDSEARMTPAVRRLLREHGLMASQIVGTGGGGRITREDVTNYVESQRTGQPVNGQVASAGSATAGTSAAASPQSSAPASAAGSGAGSSAVGLGGASSAAATSGSSAASASGTSAMSAAAPATSAPSAAAASAPSARGIQGQQVSFPEGADEVLVPMTQMRRGIANQMTRSLQVPHAYVQVEVDATKLVKARERTKRDFQAREGASLSYVPFVVKAVVHALKRNPAFNAHWTEQGLLAKRKVNMGIAVAVPDGLIVPVIHDVDTLSIAGINRAITDVAARARNARLRLDDLQGGTFTVDNTGWFGSNITLPIINVPEVAILTMENITKRPVVVETEDGDVIAIRPIMNMVLAIDHRANDGAQAAAFLNDVKNWLESIDADVPIW